MTIPLGPPHDAMIVINHLNSADDRSGEFSENTYPDVSGDSVLAPIDALLVINHLNSSILESAEGESATKVVSGVDLLGTGLAVPDLRRRHGDLADGPTATIRSHRSSADDIDAVICEQWPSAVTLTNSPQARPPSADSSDSLSGLCEHPSVWDSLLDELSGRFSQ